MKRVTFFAIPLLAVLFLWPHTGYPAGTRVLLDHKLTGYSKAESSVTVTYTLHIRNPGASPVTDLSMTLMPRPPLIGKAFTVFVGSLAPGEDKQFPLQATTPMLLDRDSIARHPLYWAGKCRSVEGEEVKFTAVSRPGGAK